MKICNLVGKRFGRLTVSSLYATKDRKKYWLCWCKCGGAKVAFTAELNNGTVKSCGCLQEEHRTSGFYRKHGLTNHRIYRIWVNMKTRCYYAKHKQYKDYGGRGIFVDERWLDPCNFIADTYEDYKKHLLKYGEMDTTLHRINNDGSYSKDNCKWATRKEQKK